MLAATGCMMDSEKMFLEFHASVHKGARSQETEAMLLPVVAPAHGIRGGCWAADYIALRESVGLALPGADPSPMLPVPAKNGMGWSSRYLTSQEMNAFIKKLFQSSNIETEGRRFSTHSCKATAISWCSKYDVGPEQRAVLARHFTAVQGPTALYSRDLLTAALRSFIRVLEAIRTEIFFSHKSRSGMLTPVPLGASVANSKAVPVTHLPAAVVKADGLREQMDLKPMELQPESVVEWPACELEDLENVEEQEAAPAKQGHQLNLLAPWDTDSSDSDSDSSSSSGSDGTWDEAAFSEAPSQASSSFKARYYINGSTPRVQKRWLLQMWSSEWGDILPNP
eukprot:s261_g28.t1